MRHVHFVVASEDMYAQDSIDMLQNSGIQFKKHEEEGIDPLEFAELLMTSGIVLVDDIKWLSFHSGYDFGYLLKLLTDQKLPQEESEFFELLRIYFPTIYDVKVSSTRDQIRGAMRTRAFLSFFFFYPFLSYLLSITQYLMKSCKNLKGGLQEVAEQLEIQRVGPQHQAGSDSLLTGMVFFKMREVGDSSLSLDSLIITYTSLLMLILLAIFTLQMFFEDNIDDAKYCGHLYGLGTSFVMNGLAMESNGDNASTS